MPHRIKRQTVVVKREPPGIFVNSGVQVDVSCCEAEAAAIVYFTRIQIDCRKQKPGTYVTKVALLMSTCFD